MRDREPKTTPQLPPAKELVRDLGRKLAPRTPLGAWAFADEASRFDVTGLWAEVARTWLN